MIFREVALTGTARPRPTPATAVLIPTTLASLSASAPPELPGLSAAGQPVEKAQDLQRLMFDEAIGRPLAITVFRNGALVDVIAEPDELVAA